MNSCSGIKGNFDSDQKSIGGRLYPPIERNCFTSVMDLKKIVHPNAQIRINGCGGRPGAIAFEISVATRFATIVPLRLSFLQTYTAAGEFSAPLRV
ncbi:MAG: hypothetical protein OXC26_12700 [Albidovulum sp.]|nr:hypothetical protein [Albidovulum sp.]